MDTYQRNLSVSNQDIPSVSITITESLNDPIEIQDVVPKQADKTSPTNQHIQKSSIASTPALDYSIQFHDADSCKIGYFEAVSSRSDYSTKSLSYLPEIQDTTMERGDVSNGVSFNSSASCPCFNCKSISSYAESHTKQSDGIDEV